jgi:hypothetical protein
VHYLNLVIDPLNQELMYSRRNARVGMNPIAAKHNAIVTLHLDDDKRSSERFAPHDELHGDDTSGLHWVAPPPPTLLSVRLVFMSSLFSHPSFLNTAYDIKLTAAPPSTSILEISFPSMWPRMYNGFTLRASRTQPHKG